MRVLCVDAGSSSLKYAAYEAAGGALVRILDETLPSASFDPGAAAKRLLERAEFGGGRIGVVGHRIVFGGRSFTEPVLASDAVLAELDALADFEPLHLPIEIVLVRAIARRRPDLAQVLCFDTAFHARMPAVAKRLPLPEIDPLLRRYGYHGLSYEHLAAQLECARGRTVAAHLGSGASLCAMRDGVPVDTTMGFTALGGLTMATRPGDLDPGIVLALLRRYGFTLDSVTDLLYHHAGLAGMSGTDGDLRALARSSDASAREAVELYEYELLKHLGSMVAVLGGVDTLVFTGGVGEHQPAIRAAACRGLRYLGVDLDERANGANERIVSSDSSAVAVLVIPADENLVIARHALARASPSHERGRLNA